MNPPAACSLVISTFDAPEYLARVLAGVQAQTLPLQEVIIADDGSGPDTGRLIAAWKADRNPMRVEHVWQQHQGFRKARILNQAIARARGDYLIFLDGDSVPHPKFVADHRHIARPGTFVQGHRALIEQQAARWFGRQGSIRGRWRALLTGQLHGAKHAFRWPRPILRLRPDMEGIRGCNLAIWRTDLLQTNGYNEEFVGWGREDSELAARLMALGVKRLDVRGWALNYHLWHAQASRVQLNSNDAILAHTLEQRLVRCARGVDQYR